MATIIVFDTAKEDLLTGGQNLSDTYRCALCSASYTFSVGLSQGMDTLCAHIHTKGSADASAIFTGAVDRKVNPPGGGGLGDQLTITAAGKLKFDLSDVNFTASSGTNICAKYGLVYASGATNPLGFWTLSTAEVVASQINVTWPSAGLFEVSSNT